MNQYRCETCNHFSHTKIKIGTGRNCPKCNCNLEQEMEVPTCKGKTINTSIVWVSNERGLCCHSDFQSERDTVLDDVKDAIDEFMLLNAKGHASLHHGLWGVIEKVRQQAGEHD
jgi:hypothetical protein